jgi:hypothetical protein
LVKPGGPGEVDNSPVPLADVQLEPYVALLVAGFAVGWYGHGLRSKWVIALGILLVVLAVGLLQLAIASEDGQVPAGF